MREWLQDPATRSRLRGSLYAGALGDALGAKTEFDSIDRIREIAGPAGITGLIPAYGGLGRITDDTQMTLFTLEGLIRAGVGARREQGPLLTAGGSRGPLLPLLSPSSSRSSSPTSAGCTPRASRGSGRAARRTRARNRTAG